MPGSTIFSVLVVKISLESGGNGGAQSSREITGRFIGRVEACRNPFPACLPAVRTVLKKSRALVERTGEVIFPRFSFSVRRNVFQRQSTDIFLYTASEIILETFAASNKLSHTHTRANIFQIEENHRILRIKKHLEYLTSLSRILLSSFTGWQI